MARLGNFQTQKVTEITSYTRLPERSQREFWDIPKIEHIRRLAETGRSAGVWIDLDSSRRVLDRIRFKNIDRTESMKRLASAVRITTDVDLSIRLAYGGLSLEAPLYLGDMSFGALSGIPNLALARAADITGVLTGTGEGGLHDDVKKCKRITIQWASARFGVDMEVLNSGLGIVIKIGQGAKPGIGGHLPGTKVTTPISETRRIPTGKDAISPAPHHDIYSIEDLGQRIWGLKEATGKPVFVKVGVTNYIPYIACGIARMGADGIIMDGQGAGTGAAPAVVKDNVGLPVEIAVASVDKMLREQGLREGFSVIAAGLVSSAEDTIKLMALGADCVSIGTATLLALGCLMVHKCHLGFCPAFLTNKITPNATRILSLDKALGWIVNLINGWSEELRIILKELGYSRISNIIGHRELLYGLNLNEETSSIFGIQSVRSGLTYDRLFATNDEEFWTEARTSHLQQLAGTIGKAGGEAVISSMGSVGPPFTETPMTITDWIRCDGAQVTRPSIDPYREEIETAVYLANGRIRLFAPIVFAPFLEELPPEIAAALGRVAVSLGTVIDYGNYSLTYRHSKTAAHGLFDVSVLGLTSDREFLRESAGLVIPYKYSHQRLSEILSQIRVECGSKPIFVRLSASKEAIDHVTSIAGAGIDGIIIDGDMEDYGKRINLEIALAEMDYALRYEPVTTEPLRNKVDLIVESKRVRGADDIVKLMGLGADAVGLSQAALIGLGYEKGSMMASDSAKVQERLENLLFGLQKEIKLLAGAAGVSSLQSSLVGNRELFRTVDMDPSVRRRLGIKPAGIG